MSMGYYNKKQNVEQYIKMADGYDGKYLIDILTKFLVKDSHILELGIGPGKDLLLLSEFYQVTGSDYSPIFVDLFKKKYPDFDVIQLDATTMKTDQQFDGIYSNKVLYHLKRDQLAESFKQQARALRDGGIALHSFWYGEGDDEMHGLHFSYYREDELLKLAEPFFDVIDVQRYTEMENDDSLYIALTKR